MSSTSQEIDNQAAEWATRKNLRELSPAEQAQFDAWLAADVRHLGAFGRADAVLARIERVSGVVSDELRSRQEVATPEVARRRIIQAGSVAASIAAVGFIGTALWRHGRDGSVVTDKNYATQIGQTREILLADGSVVTLNTNSRLSVGFTEEARNIRLLQGEALFDVAKNKKRPFVVFVDNTQVRAVGTSFTVSMLPRRPIQVLVREGVVELKRADTAAVWLAARTKALAPPHAPIVAESISSTMLARDLAWQYGQIAFDNQTLQAASAEFARYSDVRIVVDPAVANRTVTGLFAASDPIGFAKAAAEVLKLHVEVNHGEVRILSHLDRSRK